MSPVESVYFKYIGRPLNETIKKYQQDQRELYYALHRYDDVEDFSLPKVNHHKFPRPLDPSQLLLVPIVLPRGSFIRQIISFLAR